jgi:hypothetical protein
LANLALPLSNDWQNENKPHSSLQNVCKKQKSG